MGDDDDATSADDDDTLGDDDEVVPDGEFAGGCMCNTKSSNRAAPMALLLLLGLAGLRRRRAWPALLLALALVPGAALAEPPAMDAQHFQPHADRTGFYTAYSAETLDLWQPAFGLWMSYAHNPVVYYSDGEPVYEVVSDLLTMDLQAAIGFGIVDVGLDLPIHLAAVGDGFPDWNDSMEASAAGDLRLTPKVRLMNPAEKPVGLAIVLPISLPTGAQDRYVGLRTVSVTPTLAVSGRIDKFHLGANLGYRIAGADSVGDLTSGRSFQFKLGVGYALHEKVDLAGEIFGDIHSQPRNNPVEWLAGATFHPIDMMGITVAGGTSLGPGLGSPEGRLVFGIGIVPAPSRDTDGDGIKDRNDGCPEDPEDFDEFEDEDGCPDDDNDGDGFLDVSDACPNDAENFDGWKDSDGCPEQIPDTDGDGILDNVDECPNQPEDPDGFEDTDGCPDPDNDDDQILDVDDQCPDEAEVYNNNEDEDGCPDTGRVVLEKEEIVILDKVYFDLNKAVIKKESFPLLDDVAAILNRFTDIARVEVQGHTDERGSDSYNLRLSEARAKAVATYLVSKGVEESRLQSKGYGETQPLNPASNEEAWDLNRRVQFVILQQ